LNLPVKSLPKSRIVLAEVVLHRSTLARFLLPSQLDGGSIGSVWDAHCAIRTADRCTSPNSGVVHSATSLSRTPHFLDDDLQSGSASIDRDACALSSTQPTAWRRLGSVAFCVDRTVSRREHKSDCCPLTRDFRDI